MECLPSYFLKRGPIKYLRRCSGLTDSGDHSSTVGLVLILVTWCWCKALWSDIICGSRLLLSMRFFIFLLLIVLSQSDIFLKEFQCANRNQRTFRPKKNAPSGSKVGNIFQHFGLLIMLYFVQLYLYELCLQHVPTPFFQMITLSFSFLFFFF